MAKDAKDKEPMCWVTDGPLRSALYDYMENTQLINAPAMGEDNSSNLTKCAAEIS